MGWALIGAWAKQIHQFIFIPVSISESANENKDTLYMKMKNFRPIIITFLLNHISMVQIKKSINLVRITGSLL